MGWFNKKQESHCQFVESNECSLIGQLRANQKRLNDLSSKNFKELVFAKWYEVDEKSVEKMTFQNTEKLDFLFHFFREFIYLDTDERNKILDIIISAAKRINELAAIRKEIRLLKSSLGIE
jgi:hypothetical protein